MTSLATLRRIAELHVPGVHITAKRLPRRNGELVLLGLASPCDDSGIIIYDSSLRGRQRALVVLHEVAHLVFDRHDMRAAGFSRDSWREARADRWAEHMLALLEVGTGRNRSEQVRTGQNRRRSRPSGRKERSDARLPAHSRRRL